MAEKLDPSLPVPIIPTKLLSLAFITSLKQHAWTSLLTSLSKLYFSCCSIKNFASAILTIVTPTIEWIKSASLTDSTVIVANLPKTHFFESEEKRSLPAQPQFDPYFNLKVLSDLTLSTTFILYPKPLFYCLSGSK